MSEKGSTVSKDELVQIVWRKLVKQATDLQVKIGLAPLQVANLFFGIGTSVALKVVPGIEVARIFRMYAEELDRPQQDIDEGGKDLVH